MGSIHTIRSAIAPLPWRPTGQSLVEYALIIALILVVVFAALVFLGPEIVNIYKGIENNL